jgi:hypothetical protein
MNNNGYSTTIVPGKTGEFSLWGTYKYGGLEPLKSAGHGVFFEFKDVKEILLEADKNHISGYSDKNIINTMKRKV